MSVQPMDGAAAEPAVSTTTPANVDAWAALTVIALVPPVITETVPETPPMPVVVEPLWGTSVGAVAEDADEDNCHDVEVSARIVHTLVTTPPPQDHCEVPPRLKLTVSALDS